MHEMHHFRIGCQFCRGQRSQIGKDRLPIFQTATRQFTGNAGMHEDQAIAKATCQFWLSAAKVLDPDGTTSVAK